jgi:PIN domain nuclease of toxin-antitoxin system
LWLQVAPERFSEETLTVLADPRNELLLSAASAWEIAIKHELGKLLLPAPPEAYVPSRMLASGTAALPVLHVHALRVATLAPHHRDPFDRLIIAQAQHERIPVVTADRAFDLYDVEVRRP